MLDKIIVTRRFIKRVFDSDASVLVFPAKDDYWVLPKSDLNCLMISKMPGTENMYNAPGLPNKKEFILELKLSICSRIDSKIIVSKETNINIAYLYSNSFYDPDLTSIPPVNTDEILADFINFDLFDLVNYYKLYSKVAFYKKAPFYEMIEHKNWIQSFYLGLIFDKKLFSQKDSDFGSDHTQLYVCANSLYFGFNKNKVFSFVVRPSEEYGDTLYKRMRVFASELFDYYYDNKEFILLNFDEMPSYDLARIYQENRGKKFEDKQYTLPTEILSKTYILSNQTLNYLK
jgi:hypothetical protein